MAQGALAPALPALRALHKGLAQTFGEKAAEPQPEDDAPFYLDAVPGVARDYRTIWAAKRKGAPAPEGAERRIKQVADGVQARIESGAAPLHSVMPDEERTPPAGPVRVALNEAKTDVPYQGAEETSASGKQAAFAGKAPPKKTQGVRLAQAAETTMSDGRLVGGEPGFAPSKSDATAMQRASQGLADQAPNSPTGIVAAATDYAIGEWRDASDRDAAIDRRLDAQIRGGSDFKALIQEQKNHYNNDFLLIDQVTDGGALQALRNELIGIPVPRELVDWMKANGRYDDMLSADANARGLSAGEREAFYADQAVASALPDARGRYKAALHAAAAQGLRDAAAEEGEALIGAMFGLFNPESVINLYGNDDREQVVLGARTQAALLSRLHGREVSAVEVVEGRRKLREGLALALRETLLHPEKLPEQMVDSLKQRLADFIKRRNRLESARRAYAYEGGAFAAVEAAEREAAKGDLSDLMFLAEAAGGATRMARGAAAAGVRVGRFGALPGRFKIADADVFRMGHSGVTHMAGRSATPPVRSLQDLLEDTPGGRLDDRHIVGSNGNLYRLQDGEYHNLGSASVEQARLSGAQLHPRNWGRLRGEEFERAYLEYLRKNPNREAFSGKIGSRTYTVIPDVVEEGFFQEAKGTGRFRFSQQVQDMMQAAQDHGNRRLHLVISPQTPLPRSPALRRKILDLEIKLSVFDPGPPPSLTEIDLKRL